MSVSSYQKNSLGWQLQQLQQRIGEWWELQISRIDNTSSSKQPFDLDFSILGKIIEVVSSIILVLLVSWAILRLWQRLNPYLNTLRNSLARSVNQASKKTTPQLSADAWLTKSKQFQEQANYRQACRCLYMAMLQQLNDNGIILHQASRTDGEYLQLIQQLPQPQPYQLLLMTHQKLCFSTARVSSSLFEECQQAYETMMAIE